MHRREHQPHGEHTPSYNLLPPALLFDRQLQQVSDLVRQQLPEHHPPLIFLIFLHTSLSITTGVTEICRKHGIGSSAFYKWKREAVEGMKEAVAGPSREVIALKQENARLKKLVAEEALLIDRHIPYREKRTITHAPIAGPGGQRMPIGVCGSGRTQNVAGPIPHTSGAAPPYVKDNGFRYPSGI